MTASVWARCEAIVTTDNRIPTTPTKIPTRRVSGSAACSGETSSSGITLKYPQWRVASKYTSFDQVHPRVTARNAEDSASHHLDDFSVCADAGDKFADLELRAGELDDINRGIGR